MVITEAVEQSISHHFWLIADDDSSLSLSEVKVLYEESIGLGIPIAEREELLDTVTYWMVTDITNETEQAAWRLCLSFQGITHGKVWVERVDGKIRSELETGVFQKREGNAGYLGVGPKFNFIPVELTPGERSRIYVQMRNAKRYIGPQAIGKLQPFTPQLKTEIDLVGYVQGLMSGILILMIVFSGILFWLTRERSYLDYLFYLSVTMIWAAFNHGMLRETLIFVGEFEQPKYIFLIRSLIILLPYLYLRFVWSLGNLETIFPKFAPWIKRLGFISVGLFVLDWVWLLHSNFNFVLSNTIVVTIAVIVLVVIACFLPKLYQLRDDPLIRLILYAIAILTVALISAVVRMTLTGFKNIEGLELALGQLADLGIFTTALGWKFRDHIRLTSENEVIRQLLGEKDILLKEVHHRVKNNLQVVSSLLRLQTLHAKDDESKAALKESFHRLNSMTMIHEKLYQQDKVASVDVQEYFGRLSQSLLQTYQIDHSKITLLTDIDPIELDLETIMPIGLMLNELLSNALKHAFPDGQSGEIKVSIKRQGAGLLIAVADNGQGMPSGKALRVGSFGHQLVDAFARKLDGELQYISEEGTTVRLDIPKLPTTDE